MARPIKTGLVYFSIDVDMDQDDKLYMLEADQGELAFGRFIKLLMSIYREGYYKKWGENEALVFAGKKKIPLGELKDLVLSALNLDLLGLNQFKLHKILTSSGIQKRYIKACEGRKQIIIEEKYLVADLAEFTDSTRKKIKLVNTEITGINPGLTQPKSNQGTQSKVKKRKVKKRKVKEIKNSTDETPVTKAEQKTAPILGIDEIPGFDDPEPELAKAIKPSKAKNKKSALWHSIQDNFMKQHPNQFAFKRENPHIDRFCEICEAQPDPGEFALKYLKMFYSMTKNGKDKCVKGQPYLPSIMMSGGIWPRVAKAINDDDGYVYGEIERVFK